MMIHGSRKVKRMSDSNGNDTAPTEGSPAPGQLHIGQRLHEGKMWVVVNAQVPCTQIQIVEQLAEVTMWIEPEAVRGLGESFLKLANAGQTALPPQPRLIVPGHG
jgi:hypothetical protein